jgi:hypothetical protein
MLLPEFDPKNDIRRWSRCAWGPPRYYYAGDTRRGITAWSWRVPTKRTTCERRYETGRTTIRLAPRLYKMDCKWNATGKNENRKWNWKRNRNKTESDPINKNEPWTDKLKMNWLTAQTNWIISKWASPKKVTAGWARRDVICRALCCLFLIFEQRSYCPASISRTSWPPTPAKTNSGTLTCYNLKSDLTALLIWK